MRMRQYSFSFTDVAVSAQQDLFQLEAQTVPLVLMGVFLSQSSDLGDSESEGFSILIRRFTDAVTNDVAEVKLDGGDGAALANLAINETTELVTGSEIIHSAAWNILMPFEWLPPPELRPVIQVGNGVAVNLNTTPADAVTMSGTCYFAEAGN